MKQDNLTILADLYQGMLARYLSVKPQGFLLPSRSKSLKTIEARIITFEGARTLYRDRKPVCRSLDGIKSITKPLRHCAHCEHRPTCTAQLQLNLVALSRPLRLLLANTSARNFLLYEAKLRASKRCLQTVRHQLTVVPRGTWGEVRFAVADQAQPKARNPS